MGSFDWLVVSISFQALIADTSAPDPVSRAMRVAKLSHLAACNLVSEFMEGSAARLAELVKDISKARLEASMFLDGLDRLDRI